MLGVSGPVYSNAFWFKNVNISMGFSSSVHADEYARYFKTKPNELERILISYYIGWTVENEAF